MSEKYRPRRKQKLFIKTALSQGAAGFFADPGMGKTSAMLATFDVLREEEVCPTMLLCSPLYPLVTEWPNEIEKWSDFNHLRMSILHGPNKGKRLNDDVDIFGINPEGIPWLLQQVVDGRFELPSVFALDESTRFKHSNTNRFKALVELLPHFDRRYILTGTPAPNGLLDLFGQVYVLDMGLAFGRYITHYRRSFFYPTGFGGHTWLPQEDAEARIYKALGSMVVRADADKELNLPKLVIQTKPIDLSENGSRIYKKLENLFFADIESGVIDAKNAAVASAKLRQIAGGAVYIDDGPDQSGATAAELRKRSRRKRKSKNVFVVRKREYEVVDETKLDVLEGLIEEMSGQPALVAYEYAHELDRLQRRFGKHVPVIGSGTTPARVREIAKSFNAGLDPIVFVHPATGSLGLNLQGGRHVVFYAIPWNLEHYDQLIRRVWRQGQKRRVFVHHLAARGTVEEQVLKSLAKKRRTQKSLLDALLKYGTTR